MCFYHLHKLRQLKRHVGVEVMRQLITSFIFSRLDYCKALLVNLPFSTIAPLQRVQNAATRLLLGLPRRDHVRPVLKELHWLPVIYRIKVKVALMIFTVHTRRCPDYLTDSVQSCNTDPGRTCLRLASSTNYSVPRTRTKFGDKAFSVAGPVVWNSLPVTKYLKHHAICLLFVCRSSWPAAEAERGAVASEWWGDRTVGGLFRLHSLQTWHWVYVSLLQYCNFILWQTFL